MSQKLRQTFPAEKRIKNRQDFISAQNRGLRLRTPHFYVYVLSGRTGNSRLGVTVSRRVGNAVVRNRVKRLLREFFRQNGSRFSDGLDIIIIARHGAGGLKLDDVAAELADLNSLDQG